MLGENKQGGKIFFLGYEQQVTWWVQKGASSSCFWVTSWGTEVLTAFSIPSGIDAKSQGVLLEMPCWCRKHQMMKNEISSLHIHLIIHIILGYSVNEHSRYNAKFHVLFWTVAFNSIKEVKAIGCIKKGYLSESTLSCILFVWGTLLVR